MAITATLGGGLGNKTAEASTTVTIVTNAAIGDLVLVTIAADNAGVSGVSAISSVTDSTGANTYSQIKLQNQTSGAANDGVTVAIYGSVVVSALTSGVSTITVNWSPNVAAKALALLVVTGSASTAYSTGANAGSGTTYTSNASSSMASGDLFVGIVGNETNTVPGADSDTTNGSWTSATSQSAGSGGDATKMSQRTSWKVVTGAGTQTLDGSTGASTDWAVVYALYTVPAAATFSPPFRHNKRCMIVR